MGSDEAKNVSDAIVDLGDAVWNAPDRWIVEPYAKATGQHFETNQKPVRSMVEMIRSSPGKGRGL